MDSQHRTSHSFSTLRKESSADDDVILYKERMNILVPFARSPFEPRQESEPEPQPEIRCKPDELIVFVSELPWSDLLLEIAMTTAFASLTDGTPILDGPSVASYLSFFALVWWVWASQVAYNVRFRQSDWLHRFFAFFQLVVFCSLAAHTNNFDVTNGIVDDSEEERKIAELQMADLASQDDVAVANFRNNRLPTLNARGISITMAFSRLLLLGQYLLAFFHANRKGTVLGDSRRVRPLAFFVHIGTLGTSSLCYFIAYVVIGKSPDKDDHIAKIVLWYLPVLVEAASHFVAASLPGRVRYPAKDVYARSATVFVIILGGGLDKITTSFQYIVGNVSLSLESLIVILYGVLIFTLLFTLYFSTSEGDIQGSRRALALFFFSFVHLSAVIVTLQGIAAMLKVGNISSALKIPFRYIMDTQKLLESKGFGVHLDDSDYSYDQVRKLNKTGVALATLLDYINWGIDDAVNNTDYNLTFNYLLKADTYIIATVLTNFKSMPEDGSLLLAKLSLFYDTTPRNYTVVNNVTFNEVAEGIITQNASPARWFYAAGGAVLVTLAFMSLINRWPRDRYECGQTISRLLIGSIIIGFTAVDMNASSDVLDPDLKYQGSRIWYLAMHSLVLPPYAAALFLEQLIELALLYTAGRSYNNFSFSLFWRKVPRVNTYVQAGSAEQLNTFANGEGMVKMHDEPSPQQQRETNVIYDPYDPYEKTEYVPLPRPDTNVALVTSPPAGAPSFKSQTDSENGPQTGGRRTRNGFRQMSSESSIQPLISR